MLNDRHKTLWRVNRYLWICLAVLAVWLAAKWSSFSPMLRAELLLIYVLGAANVGMRSYIGYNSPRGISRELDWASTIADICLIAVSVKLTGGMNSDLWLVYFFLVVTQMLSISLTAELALNSIVLGCFTWGVWPIHNATAYGMRVAFILVTGGIARRLHENAEQRSAQLSLVREQLQVEQEKSRLAREIHDGVGREVVNAILGLEVAARASELGATTRSSDGTEMAPPELIRENIAILRSAMDSTRQLIFETRPWTLDDADGGLGPRISEYARRFSDRSGIVVDVTIDPDLGLGWGVSQPVAFAILRIVQEALNNAYKHARAKRIEISARKSVDGVTVTVRDDGVGFEMSKLGPSAGIGLDSMRERAQAFGGDLRIDAASGAGTGVTVTMPVV